MSFVIELQGLEVKFGARRILKGLSSALSARSIGLLGPNGAGKTTLIHTLMGFHPPTSGRAALFGKDVHTETREIRRRVGYMPENDAFLADMSAVRFVRLMAELSGLPPREALERAHETLFYVGLGEARYRRLGTYSLGMKQMAKLAQAIVHGPNLLFLDEPTNGLDPPHRANMLRLVREIRDRGVHVVLSSHLLPDVEECCDEVLVLKDGAIAAHCDLAEERRTHRRFLELETRGDDGSFAAAVERLGCELALHGTGRMKMILPEGIEIAQLYRLAADKHVQIRKLNYKRDSLQDLFLRAMENPNGGV
jgi:ABC-2 type transport system ATP-binding protein